MASQLSATPRAPGSASNPRVHTSPVCLQELTAAKKEVHKLQSALFQRDAELEQKRLEVDSLQRDKGSLDKLLQERQAEITETQARLQAAMVSDPGLWSVCVGRERGRGIGGDDAQVSGWKTHSCGVMQSRSESDGLWVKERHS